MSARHRWAWPGTELKPHERILSFLRDNGETGATAATVGVLTGCTTSQAHHRLEALVRRGEAIRDGDRYTAVAPTSQGSQGVGHARTA
ncbi:hypothetical protein [Streptomyces umbrinus]|uniref:hypothetical protein n=1 Tax=Streptomyces umbrinus TaxID=67370 RepID=UPI0033D3EEA0